MGHIYIVLYKWSIRQYDMDKLIFYHYCIAYRALLDLLQEISIIIIIFRVGLEGAGLATVVTTFPVSQPPPYTCLYKNLRHKSLQVQTN